MNKNHYAVIMAGGVGERFWPMSRNFRPKQFIDILGTGKSLLQQTHERFLQILDPRNIYIITNVGFVDLVKEQIPDIDSSQIICEPTRKNTGPCIAYAAHKICALNPKAILVVAPSDHVILKETAFASVIKAALDAASVHDWLFTLGITPSRPDTGYGYIQFIEGNIHGESSNLRKVKTFTEKPNQELAESFIDSGDFLWNSGIFIWSCKAIMDAFEKYQPEISYVFREATGKYNSPEEWPYMSRAYSACKSISIDYAIMEKAENVYVFISDLGWSDLGTWGSLYEVRSKDSDENTVVGKDVLMYDSHKCIVNVSENKIVVIQGLNEFIVAESDNALLICERSQEHQLRKMVNDVKLKKGDKYI